MDNKSIARILRDTAQLLEIDGAIIGRYRSYEKAAELISGMHESIEELAKDPDKLEELPGFGEKSEQNILKAVEAFKRSTGRFRLDVAEAAAEGVIAHIEQFGKGVASITPAGSLRRGKETVGDLDLLLTLADGFTAQKYIDSIAEHILKYPRIDQVLAHGENKVSFTLDNGIQVDVRLLDKDSFGAALLYFTGSREHNVTLRGRANDIGYTLNEYALATLKGERRVAGRTEEEIYAKLKLDFIPP